MLIYLCCLLLYSTVYNNHSNSFCKKHAYLPGENQPLHIKKVINNSLFSSPRATICSTLLVK